MKVLYFECTMGAAGDMLAAALLELIPNQDAFLDTLNKLAIPSVHVSKKTSVKCGIHGTQFSVTIDGETEKVFDVQAHEHEHRGHDHFDKTQTSHHHHRGLAEIEQLIENLPLSLKVKEDIWAVYCLIAEAESKIHGVPLDKIHFHELGSMDALADITAVCLLMETIAPEQVVVSPIHVGSGHVRCAHGIVPVPAPATADILRSVPIYGGEMKGELCTPTGAALLVHFATRFGTMPVMRTQSIGYGMGQKDFAVANCVRAWLGDSENEGEFVVEFSCNLDDMTAEALSFAMERFFEAGALEVYTLPACMKKSRPGMVLCVMCRETEKEKMLHLLFKHTSTLGIRENTSKRHILSRKVTVIDSPVGVVRQKQSEGYGSLKSKYEFEDLACIARSKGLSLADVIKLIEER